MTFVYRIYGAILLRISCEHDAGGGRGFFTKCLKYLDARHSRHAHIADNNSNFALALQYFQGPLASHRGNDLKFAAELTAKTIQ